MKTMLCILLLCTLTGCSNLFCKKQEPVIQVVKEVIVEKRNVPDNLLIPCAKHGDYPYDLTVEDLFEIGSIRRVQNNLCADQMEKIIEWSSPEAKEKAQ